MQISVWPDCGRQVDVDVQSNATVEQLKDAIYSKIQIPREEQRLYFAEQLLDDRKLLAEHGVGPRATVRLMRTLGDQRLERKAAKAPVTASGSEDSKIEVAVIGLSGQRLATLFAEGSRCIEGVKQDLQARLGDHPRTQKLMGQEMRLLRDHETVGSLAAESGMAELTLIRADAKYEAAKQKFLRELTAKLRSFQSLPEEFRGDADLILAAIQVDATAFLSVPEGVRADRSFVVRALEKRSEEQRLNSSHTILSRMPSSA
eukprot:TRINITY_DN54911_c0_g1_i1.p1 TRINITY_DN54911_c0_g1~~TRINITY_DN54911_c0_g1_i1.p1  ORF type:complete len:260 (-),score=43.08 TRINITY_DN54911_c0_g1_i1:7-786(-)